MGKGKYETEKLPGPERPAVRLAALAGDGGDDTPQRDGTPRPRRLLPGELLLRLIRQSGDDNMLCDFRVRDGMIKFAFHCADGRSYVWEQLLLDYVNNREGIWVVPSADVDRFVGR